MNNKGTQYPAPMGTRTRVDAGEGERGGGPFSMTNGYIRLHRSFLEWEWYDDEACVSMFVHLLLIVNWKETRWHGETLPAGSKIISQLDLANKFGWSRQKVGRTLEKLKSTGEVITKAGSKWTLVTVAKWDKYQVIEDVTGHQAGTKRAPAGHQPGTEEEGKKERKKEERGVPPSRMKFEEFRAACLEAHKASGTLSSAEAKSFFDYWTEGHMTGKGRWQLEKVFDIQRRMATWSARAKVAPNGKPVPMTKAEAHAKLEEYRAANGIAPGGVVETHKIPADIYAALK